jgi:hypothetical protein
LSDGDATRVFEAVIQQSAAPAILNSRSATRSSKPLAGQIINPKSDRPFMFACDLT